VSYRAPSHIAVVNAATKIHDREVAFWVEAVAKQVLEVAAVWNLPPPGVALYSSDVTIPSALGSIIVVADNDGDPETAGYHTPMGGIVDISQSQVPSRTLSHEVLEMLANLMLDRWLPGPTGRRYAVELCDPVQRESYTVPVHLWGVQSEVPVSNWVTPAWFDAHGAPPFDRLDRLDAPFALAPGGYAIARDTATSEVVFLAHPQGAAFGARKFRGSRTRRIVERFG
jgi:hypothetical protein